VLLGVGLDFIENAAQIAALGGMADALGVKTLVTPAKFTLVYLGIALALGAAALAGARMLRAR
jgi:hypothetical protein